MILLKMPHSLEYEVVGYGNILWLTIGTHGLLKDALSFKDRNH